VYKHIVTDGMCGHIVTDGNNTNPPPILLKQKQFKTFEIIRVNIGSFKL